MIPKFENVFLQLCKKKKLLVEIKFVDGTENAYRIVSFDSFTIVVKESQSIQLLLYKKNIISIQVSEMVIREEY